MNERIEEIRNQLRPGGDWHRYESDLPLFDAAVDLLAEVDRLQASAPMPTDVEALAVGHGPRSEWSDEQKIKFDGLVFGTGIGRRRSDGTLEHIPVKDVVIEINGKGVHRWVGNADVAVLLDFRKKCDLDYATGDRPTPSSAVLAALDRLLAR